jgi:hypothetical protein
LPAAVDALEGTKVGEVFGASPQHWRSIAYAARVELGQGFGLSPDSLAVSVCELVAYLGLA